MFKGTLREYKNTRNWEAKKLCSDMIVNVDQAPFGAK